MEYCRNRSSQKDGIALLKCHSSKRVLGPSAKLLAENSELQDMVAKVKLTGVELSCCVVCSDEYGVTEKLDSLGIDMIHTGEILTDALKEDWKVITF